MLRRYLERSPTPVFIAFAILTAFSTYFAMYAFRRPFSVGTYADAALFGSGVKLKTALVIAQLVGYTISKYLGVKFVAEMTRARRAAALIVLVLLAQAALLLFAVLPPSLKPIAMLLNGLPLGMVWGLVVWYLEGRRTSELLLAGLSCSFIIASGVVKDVGRWLMSGPGISESWMPFATGAVFLVPYIISVWLLNQLPDPTPADVAERVERAPMNRADRWAFVRRFAPGLVLLFVTYFFLTAYRDYRDNYGVEVLRELGYDGTPAIFTKTELPIAVGVLVALAALNLIRNNRAGLMGALGIMAFGALLMGGATWAHDAGAISGVLWMILIGLGAYLCYVPYGSVLFDRLMASTGFVGTAVFAIYLADALGYTGSIAVQLYKDLGAPATTRLAFLRLMTYAMSAGGLLMLAFAAAYFWNTSRRAVPTPKNELPGPARAGAIA